MKITASFNFYITNIQPPIEYKEVQITNSFVVEFWFIESLEQMFLTGEITLLDKQGYFETINFTGEEQIRVIIQQELTGRDGKVNTLRKVIDFEIYEVMVGDIRVKNTTFTLKLIEVGAWKFYGKNYNKGYNNKRVSDIMNDVLLNQLKLKSENFVIEPTTDILPHFSIPFWKPLFTIKYLKKKARRAADIHEGGYVFYTSTGSASNDKDTVPKKYFVSLSSLLEKDFINDDLNKYTFKASDANPMFINNIQEGAAPVMHRRSVLRDGIGGKRYFGVNYNNDSNIIEKKMKYSDYFKKSKTIADVSIFRDSIDSVNDEVDFYGGNDFSIEAALSSSFRQLLESYNLREYVLEGALFRYCGQIIWIEENSDKDGGLYHKHNTGKWLVRDITHFYKNGFYSNKLIVTKDSYEQSDLISKLVK